MYVLCMYRSVIFCLVFSVSKDVLLCYEVVCKCVIENGV
jgi:hypothetical protein